MADLDEELNAEGEEDIITLTDDEGNDFDFYHLATLDYKENWYIVLQPVEVPEDMTEDDVVIYKLGTDENGEDTILPIEDDEELDGVFAEFETLMQEDGCGEDGCTDCGCTHCNC